MGEDKTTVPFPVSHSGGSSDQDDEIDLLGYWRVLSDRRALVLGLIGVTLLIGAAATLLTTPQYEASTSLKIERQSPEILTHRDVLGIDPMAYKDFYQTQYKLMGSRAVLRRTVERLDLVHRPEFAGRRGSPIERISGWAGGLFGGDGKGRPLENRAIEFIEEGLAVSPTRNSHLVRISFLDRDPVLARDVVDAVAEAYQQFNLEARYTTTEQASEFLTKEVVRTRAEIARLERQLQQYGADREILALSDGAQDISEQALADLNSRLTEARGRMALARARYDSVRDASADSLPEVLQSPLIQNLKKNYADLERSYSLQARRFEPGWPALAALRDQLHQAETRLNIEIEDVSNRVRSAARADHARARGEVTQLEIQVDGQKLEVQRVNRDTIQYGGLKAEIETRRGVLGELVARQSQTETSGQLRDSGASNIRVVDRAEIPERPARPSMPFNLFVSLLVGTFFGVGSAFLLHYVDNTIKTEHDVQRYAPGISVLGHVPLFDGQKNPDRGQPVPSPTLGNVDLVSAAAPNSTFAEAFRSLRTSLLLASPDHPPRVILVTSCEPGDGKSVISINMATVLTQLGRKVLLIDADLRRPRLHRALQLPNDFGMSSYLTGNAELPDLFQPTPVPGLQIITSGPIPPNPAELLGSPALDAFLARLREMPFDHIVIDSTPTVQVADSIVLATKTDATILVTRSGATPRESLIKASTRLRAGRAKLAGAVLNAVSERSGYYYRRYGYYGPRPGDSNDTAGQEAQSASSRPRWFGGKRRAG